MKENVFIYFPGCISLRNMLTFETQGCRFTFEVVFNHSLALKFLLCSESGLHRATGPVHSQNIYIWSIAHEIFFIALHVTEDWVLRNGNVEYRKRHMKLNKRIFRTGCICMSLPFFYPTGPPSGCCGSSRPAAAQLPQAIFLLYHHLY